MRRIVYISTATGMPAAEVDRIVAAAEQGNFERQITGFLIYNGRNFLQLIEGERRSLEPVWNSIRADPRHSPVVLVGQAYWAGLLDWIRDTLVTGGAVDASDLDLLRVTDDPDEVVGLVKAYAAAGTD